jgi:hypothetical protein
MSQQSHLRSVDSPAGSDTRTQGRAQRQRAGRALPTDRMKMELQVKVLEAIGRLSGAGKRAVTGQELSRAVGGLAPATVILSNRFMADAGWIENKRGEYKATDALVEYCRRRSIDTSGDPTEALREPATQSWFWQALHPYFVNGKLSYSDAALHLSREARANPDHEPMIANLIAWLEWVGLIEVEDGQVSLTAQETGSSGQQPEPPADQRPAEPLSPAAEPAGTASKEPTMPPGGTPRYVISFDVRMTQDDLNRLSSEQVGKFLEAFGTVVTLSKKI